jgi:hypothetical protein
MNQPKDNDLPSNLSMIDLVNKVNQFLPLHNMWDGLWVHAAQNLLILGPLTGTGN